MTEQLPAGAAGSPGQPHEQSLLHDSGAAEFTRAQTSLDGSVDVSQRSTAQSVDPRASAESSISSTYRRYLHHLSNSPPRSPSPPPSVAPSSLPPQESTSNPYFHVFPEWNAFDQHTESNRLSSLPLRPAGPSQPGDKDSVDDLFEEMVLGADDISDTESELSMQDSVDGYQDPEKILFCSSCRGSPIYLVKWQGVSTFRSSWEYDKDWDFLKESSSPIMREWREELKRRANGESNFDMDHYEACAKKHDHLMKLKRMMRRYKRQVLRQKRMAEMQAVDSGVTLPIRLERPLTAREWELPQEQRVLLIQQIKKTAEPNTDVKGKGKALESSEAAP